MIVVPESDSLYKEWVAGHPEGFVLNTRSKKKDPNYMVLHRASCWTISPLKKALSLGAFTEAAYKKVCAEKVEQLQLWVRDNGRPDGSFSKLCSHCAPTR